MDTARLTTLLTPLPLGPWRCFAQIDSTNSEAARWAEAGAPDRSLIIADEQTAGRGRLGRRWYTPAGAALAFSLLLRPEHWPDAGAPIHDPQLLAARLTALGALAVCETLQQDYHLPAQIKWPNDILIERRKTAGILVEAHWQDGKLAAAILGIGINVAPEAVPPPDQLLFPATCLQAGLDQAIDRMELLRNILVRILDWTSRLAGTEFIRAWETQLAFKGEMVVISNSLAGGQATGFSGQLTGLDEQGRLLLLDSAGQIFSVDSGEVHLRPASAGPGFAGPIPGG